MPRLNLNVPYADKDSAKALGARWDAKRRTWYLADARLLDRHPELRKWLPREAELPAPKPVSVSSLAQLSACEQQLVFDTLYGRKRSLEFEARGRAGVAEHRSYERAVARGAKPAASPCFIATTTFGQDAFETSELRRFRNRTLRRTRRGRALIRLYERLSPPLARRLPKHPRTASLIRTALRALIGWLPR